ncbi:MAG: hypothetical protein RI947_1357 [Candidatus Parcubacteria bacterium]
MINTLLLVLIILLVVNYLQIPVTNFTLFYIGGHPITLYNIIVFFIVLWLAKFLPSPFREIIGVILILWLLSLFGIFLIPAFSNIIVLILIIALLVYVFGLF